MRTNLVKISGDLVGNKKALDFIRKLRDNPYHVVTVIAGGGKQINAALRRRKLPVRFHKEGHRIHLGELSRQIAVDALEGVENALARELFCNVIVPVLKVGFTRCHVNADDYLRMLAPNFGAVYCLTKKGRKKSFPSYIKVVRF